MEPVQAPVMGSGIATKITSAAESPYLAAPEVNFLRVRAKSQSKNFRHMLYRCISHRDTGSSNHRMNTTGIRLPSTAQMYACHHGILNDVMPMGIAARSSAMGIMLMSTVASQCGIL